MALSQSVGQRRLEAEAAKNISSLSMGESNCPQVPWSADLPTTVGGVVSFNIAPEEPFCIQIEQTKYYPKPQHEAQTSKGSKKPKYLLLRIEETRAGFYIKYDDGTEELKCQVRALSALLALHKDVAQKLSEGFQRTCML